MAAFRVVEDDVVQDYKCPERSREAGQGPVPIAACLGERTGPCEATERERGKLLDSSVACRCDYLIVRSHERVNCSPISTRKSGRGYGGYTRNPESYVATEDGHSLAQARGTPTATGWTKPRSGHDQITFRTRGDTFLIGVFVDDTEATMTGQTK